MIRRRLKDDLELAARACQEAMYARWHQDVRGAAQAAAAATVRAMWRAELVVYVREAMKNALDVPPELKEAQVAEFRAMSVEDLAEDLADKDSDVGDWVAFYDDRGESMAVLMDVVAELRREGSIP